MKSIFARYFQTKKLDPAVIQTLPYPINPEFCLEKKDYLLARQKQLNPSNHIPTRVLVPISGAAVQLNYLEHLLILLARNQEKPYIITTITKAAPFTKNFLIKFKRYQNIEVVAGANDRETVDLYTEQFKKQTPPALEITKPSEQTFKILAEPNQLGGVIMLFAAPVGRQEIDNLGFMLRHGLIPNKEESELLYRDLLGTPPKILPQLMEKARAWRGLILPKGSNTSAGFINNCLRLGLFTQMLSYRRKNDFELMPDGVSQFWQLLVKRLA
jgi:hypothetical protein